MTEHDLTKLQGCHPELVARISRVLAAMTALGVPMLVTDGVRTTVQQQLLYAQGRTVPGPIVTNADGVTKLSNHQLKSDGFGHACDVAFVVNGQPTWDLRMPWKAYCACVEAVGLVSGGSWTGPLHDLPHAELSK